MADLATRDRLLPSLLDRLTDFEPEKKAEAREFKVLSLSQLRQCVLRDLNWLVNATRLESTDDLSRHDHVRRSVLNFGLPSLSGYTVSQADIGGIARTLREAIVNFEPRLIPESVEVLAVHEEGTLNHHNRVSFKIQAQLWAQPAPIELLVQTEMDFESGQNRVVEARR